MHIAILEDDPVQRELLTLLVPQEELTPKQESFITTAVRRTLGIGSKVVVAGLDNALIYLAKCCKPIRGEEIIGYITRGKGVSVHRADCANVRKLMFDPERQIEVSWERGDDGLFEATLQLIRFTGRRRRR